MVQLSKSLIMSSRSKSQAQGPARLLVLVFAFVHAFLLAAEFFGGRLPKRQAGGQRRRRAAHFPEVSRPGFPRSRSSEREVRRGGGVPSLESRKHRSIFFFISARAKQLGGQVVHVLILHALPLLQVGRNLLLAPVHDRARFFVRELLAFRQNVRQWHPGHVVEKEHGQRGLIASRLRRQLQRKGGVLSS